MTESDVWTNVDLLCPFKFTYFTHEEKKWIRLDWEDERD